MTSPRPRALLAAASVAVALAAADTYVVVLVLTDMMTGVGVGIDSLQKATPIISGFLLGYIAVLPLIGRLADLVPRQRVLLVCLAVFVVGSLVTAHAHDLGILVTGRVIQGVGGGGLVPATLALVADLWPAGRRGTPLGVVGAVQELGSVLGPLLGAAVVAFADWRAIFSLGAVVGVLLAVAILGLGGSGGSGGADRSGGSRGSGGSGGGAWGRPVRTLLLLAGLAAFLLAIDTPDALLTSVAWGGPFVPFPGHTHVLLTPMGVVALVLLGLWAVLALRRAWPVLRRADLPGAALLGTTLGLVILTFASANPEREVVGPLGYAALPVAALTLALYLWRHRVTPDPLVPRGAVVGPGRVALLVSLLVGVALVAIVVDVPLLARLVLTSDETTAALVLVRFLVAVPVGAFLGGWLLRRAGAGVVAALGLAMTAAALFVMATWGQGSLDAPWATVVLAGAGLGVGLVLAPVNDAMLAAAPDSAHGTASALVVVARMVGMVVGLALLTAIGLHRYYQAVSALPDPTDAQALVGAGVVQVRSVFFGAGLAAAVGAVAAVLGLPRRRAEVPDGAGMPLSV